jgi:iron complex outermembrane receptor protein
MSNETGDRMNTFPVSRHTHRTFRRNLSLAAGLCAWLLYTALALAQGVALQGSVADSRGGLIAHAGVSARSESTGKVYTATTDAQGQFSFGSALPAGLYDVTASAPGFQPMTSKAVAQNGMVAITLPVAVATADITVDADQTHSVAAALAPMDALLDETSARTEITSAFIRNFTSPVADYGEIVNYVPGTFTTSSDGVGLGQSKTYFRGFPDGDYDIDYDGIPFYDTNTPTHHSWAFFPTQSIGGVDFDRSPGTASTIGPTPFGGSIHLLSPTLSPVDNLRVNFSGGSFNTYLYDAQYDSGSFGPGHKFNLTTDVHHLQSHGFQSLNNQNQNSGDLKVEYRFSDKTVITGYSGVIWVDANTPNFSATRCQMYGVSATNAYSCTISGTTLYPYTGAGVNFLLTNNSDPLLYLDTQYNFYHVPTDFEYVGIHKEFSRDFILDIKPYTYNYDNSEKYSNATTITELTSASFPATANSPKGTYLGLPVAPCNAAVTKKGVTALPCGVDKYNSYRKYGETAELSQVSRFGILRAGMWYEWANTNRHQYPSDPLTNWTDQALPNFAEKFVTDSYQPFVEYQFHVGKKLNITPGVKLAYYTIGTQQFADDGKTIGCLVAGCNPATGANINTAAFIANGGSYFSVLPSGSVNYRIRSNWSAYFQGAQGSIVPPSSVFDFQQGTSGTAIPPAVLPKQQLNTTYQAGSVVKLKYVTLDLDYFHIYFDNSYSSTLNAAGEPVFYQQPASVTQGFEAESNISLTHGVGLYINGSYDSAKYTGNLPVSCVSGAAGCTATTAQLIETAPSGLNVAQTPSDIETEGVTYQHGHWDAAFFDKRVGGQSIDNGVYHNQLFIAPFNVANAFVNYTLRSGSLNQTRFSVSFNNILNSSNVTGISPTGTALTLPNIAANGTTYPDNFNTSGPTPIAGQDTVSILPGRSIMLSVTFGFSPKER